ncbi:MAG: hypothetical protein DPW09_07000 [Anaerolineae bacterium]|nr:hypothetical protein [Anaerolineales bacterium]MCQ3973179.1 hypothetical protein [Anaerolineae bacterium]
MKRTYLELIISLFGLSLLGLSFGTAAPALAHGGIEAGPYELVLGWVNEPPLLGEHNAVYLKVINSQTHEPVAGLNTLEIAVTVGGQTRPLQLSHLLGGQPGEYAASFIPTVRGVYTVQLSGKIEEQEVNVTAEIEEVEPAADYQFPTTIASLPELSQQLTILQNENQSLQATVTFTRWLALGGLVSGLAGLGLGIFCFLRK